MMTNSKEPKGPDLTLGVARDELVHGKGFLGHVGDDDVLLVRLDDDFFAIEPYCTHYHGPLIEGLVTDGAIRCPWHHACFDLRTGEALRAPAFDSLTIWEVEALDDKIFVRHKQRQEKIESSRRAALPANDSTHIVIVGGGAAGLAAAEMLRRQDFQGSIVMLSNDAAPPVDRPNLSKDYLSGSAPADWVDLRPAAFYSDNAIDLRLNTEVTTIDIRSHQIGLSDGKSFAYDRLLLATGAEPVRLWIPGGNEPHVHSLRSLADCQKIIAAAQAATKAVVLGASFIGLEVAAALRARGLEVHVAAPENVPMERILGKEMGQFVRSLHEGHGIIFHLNETAVSLAGNQITLKSGRILEADFVVAGIGVRPRIELAAKSGLLVERGVVVNACLETSAAGVFAAGDIARWPDKNSGENIRVEHWVVAERQGQTAALNLMGHRESFTAVPFFWSQHYDVSINYIGHAERWDEIAVEGDMHARDCILRFKRDGRTLAIASINRDQDSLRAEYSMEKSAAHGA